MDEQRAAAVLSKFKGGGYDADGLLHTLDWYSAVQLNVVKHLAMLLVQHLSTNPQTHSQFCQKYRQRHITSHVELESHQERTPVVKELIGSIHTLNKGQIYNSVPAAELHVFVNTSQRGKPRERKTSDCSVLYSSIWKYYEGKKSTWVLCMCMYVTCSYII